MYFVWDLFAASSNIGIPFYPEPDIHLFIKLPRFFWTAFPHASQACSGDVTAITDIGGELLEQGLISGVVADPGMLVEAVGNVVSLHDGINGFRSSITNFSKFSRTLANQLELCGDKADSATLVTVDRHYNMFMECDLDGSGGVSLEEYVIFCSKEGVPASMAEIMFIQADIDGNGEFSF